MARVPQKDLLKSLESSGSSDKGFFESLTDNPIFGAGVGVAGVGVGLTLLRRGALSGILLAQRHLTTSLEIPSKDRSYQWVLQWINASTKGRTQHIGVETRITTHDNGSHSTNFDFVPSPGRHYIWYKRHLIQVEREREKNMVDINSGTPWETVKLTLFGRDPQVFTQLLEEAKESAMKRDEGKVVVYMPMMTDWRPFGRPRAKRPLNSVILDEGLADKLVADVEEFHRASGWYAQRGIPHRRGYLLYGPPGSGKSSFIQAMAGHLSHNICVLNLNDRGLTDDRLLHLMTDVPPRSFILLEDIDAVFNKRESSYTVTFSGLLNALDGVTSAEERIVFMTTNHPDRLDPALVRPGRVDIKAFVGYSTPYQQRAMFLQFYPDFVHPDESEHAPAHLRNKSKKTSLAALASASPSDATSATGAAEDASVSSNTIVSASNAAAVAAKTSSKASSTGTTAEEDSDQVSLETFFKSLNAKFPLVQNVVSHASKATAKLDDAAVTIATSLGLPSQSLADVTSSSSSSSASTTLTEAAKAARLAGVEVDSTGSETGALANMFVAQLRGVEVSMAELQGLMLMNKQQPRSAVRAAAELRVHKEAQARERALAAAADAAAALDALGTGSGEGEGSSSSSSSSSSPSSQSKHDAGMNVLQVPKVQARKT